MQLLYSIFYRILKLRKIELDTFHLSILCLLNDTLLFHFGYFLVYVFMFQSMMFLQITFSPDPSTLYKAFNSILCQLNINKTLLKVNLCGEN